MDALQPLRVYLVGTLDEVGIGVDTQALVKEYLAITALTTTDKEDKVVLGSETGDVRHAVRHTTADGVEALEGSVGGDMLLDIFDNLMKLIERLGGL